MELTANPRFGVAHRLAQRWKAVNLAARTTRLHVLLGVDHAESARFAEPTARGAPIPMGQRRATPADELAEPEVPRNA